MTGEGSQVSLRIEQTAAGIGDKQEKIYSTSPRPEATPKLDGAIPSLLATSQLDIVFAAKIAQSAEVGKVSRRPDKSSLSLNGGRSRPRNPKPYSHHVFPVPNSHQPWARKAE